MDTYTIITGATSGIGLNIAKKLSSERNILLLGRSQERLDKAIAQMKAVNTIGLVCDLNTDRRVLASRLSEFITSRDIQVDTLVHCAGISQIMPARRFETNTIDMIFNVNVLSVMELIKVLLKKENKGALRNILLISSLASIRGERGNAIYAASKGALNSLAVTLAKELAPKVRVNTISPGTVETPMTQSFLDTEEGQTHLETYPLGVGHCEEIANLASFLLSTDSRWITGQNIVIDGGRSTY